MSIIQNATRPWAARCTVCGQQWEARPARGQDGPTDASMKREHEAHFAACRNIVEQQATRPAGTTVRDDLNRSIAMLHALRVRAATDPDTPKTLDVRLRVALDVLEPALEVLP